MSRNGVAWAARGLRIVRVDFLAPVALRETLSIEDEGVVCDYVDSDCRRQSRHSNLFRDAQLYTGVQSPNRDFQADRL